MKNARFQGLTPFNNPGVQAPASATAIKWDAENRLISYKIGSTTYNYQYDHLSRLITRLNGSAVQARYHYDGWNRIAEFNNTTLLDTFTWGLDLSGTLQGAGGVGGLLVTRWVSSGNTDYFVTYDGNGNVSEYLANGSIIAHYEYDPFGTLTRRTGSTSTRLQYRFSTKPRDPNSGLYYYGYRWYDPYTGRWPSRDPIEEEGCVNLYGFVGNGSVNLYDMLGLSDEASNGKEYDSHCCCIESIDKGTINDVIGTDVPNNKEGGTYNSDYKGHRWNIAVKLSQNNTPTKNKGECGCSMDWWEWNSYDGKIWKEKNSLKEKNNTKSPFLYHTFPWNTWYPNNRKDSNFDVIDYPILPPNIFGTEYERYDQSNKRELYIKAVFKSAADCNCTIKQRTVYMKQLLEFDKGGKLIVNVGLIYNENELPKDFPE